MNRRLALVASLFVAIAVARIAATYPRFSQTFDEPVHVAMGLEWLDHGSYTLELQHPPLARIFDALVLRLAGERYPAGPIVLTDPAVPVRKGNAIFGGPDEYQRNLTLARIGVLPFLLLAAWIIFHWTRAIASTEAAVAAVALFTFLPPILGHSGLATTDMAITATLAAAVYALVRCLESPTPLRVIVLGVAVAAAVLSKFSAIPFLAVILIGVLIASRPRAAVIGRCALALAITLFLIWACYRFSVWPAPLYGYPPNELLTMLGTSTAPPDRALFFLLTHFPLPAPEFFAGLAHLGEHTLFGHPSYFFGEVRTHGIWYFFPVIVALKTPIAFLILAGAGLRKAAIPAIAAGSVLLVAMASRINLGVRHVLPIYPFLAIAAGIALVTLFPRRRIIVAVLATWIAVTNVLAHPDYLASFNELAGSHPERIVVDSDLDWGQDLPRLREAVHAHGVDRLWLAYFGTTDLSRYPLAPAVRRLPPRTRVQGWVAISKTTLKGAYGSADDYAWLDHETPVAEIGESMLLYRTK